MADVSQIRLPNGDTFDLIDEKSGYITAQYIENRTDYSIPVSRVGEIVVGETAIGTDSTNFPTSKAVVDYVDERVVQEINAIDVGVTSVNGKTGSVTLSASDVGAATINQIPTSTSQLTNDSGYVVGPSSSVNNHVATFNGTTGNTIQDSGYTIAKSVPSSAVFTDQRVESQVISASSSFKGNYPILLHTKAKLSDVYTDSAYKMATFYFHYGYTGSDVPYLKVQNATLASEYLSLSKNSGIIYSTRIQIDSTLNSDITLTLPKETGTLALTSDIPTVPTNISAFTNDSGYLTASDIASVMTYKGTKANYAALPSTGNTTGDVWHLTDTGAEWAWDGSAWQELGTAIDVSGFVSKSGDTMTGSLYVMPASYSSNQYQRYIELSDTRIGQMQGPSGIVITPDEIGFGATNNANNTRGYITITPKYLLSTVGPYLQFAATFIGSDIHNYNPILRGIGTPTDNTDAANKKYVDDSIGAISIPTKTSDLTNDSGFLTSFTETDPTVPSWAKASTKPTYTAAEVGALPASAVIPTKTSELTNDSGFITSYTDEKVKNTVITEGGTFYLIGSSGASTATESLNKHNAVSVFLTADTSVGDARLILGNSITSGNNQKKGLLRLYGPASYYTDLISGTPSANRTITLPNASGTIALTSDIPDTSSFLTSETDPVFSASAAAGITATDISNWNAKVSDDKTWNGVTLNTGTTNGGNDVYIPALLSTTATIAYQLKATSTPGGQSLAKYSSGYLYSTTPSANDNSTKVATTAYVDSTVPKIHIIDLAYDDTIDGKSIYNSGDFTCEMVKDYIDNNELVILKMYQQFYYFDAYDRGVSDLTFVAQNFGSIGKDVLTPYKESGGGYSNKWCAFASDLPIYDGTVE